MAPGDLAKIPGWRMPILWRTPRATDPDGNREDIMKQFEHDALALVIGADDTPTGMMLMVLVEGTYGWMSDTDLESP